MEYLSAKQVIEILQIDRTTLYRMLNAKRIHGVKVGSKWMFAKDEIESLLPGRKSRQSAQNKSTGAMLPIHCIQPIQEVFSDMVQIAAVTVTAEGKPLTQFSNSCTFCKLILSSKAGRKACQHSWREIELGSGDKPRFAVCHAGLTYAGADISLAGNPVARLIVGQFFQQNPGTAAVRKMVSTLSERYNIPKEDLQKAAMEIKVIDKRLSGYLGKWMQKVAAAFATMEIERRELMKRLSSIADLSKL